MRPPPDDREAARDASATTVVAVVWTYDRCSLAERCVRAVLAQDRSPDRVIVVDSASPDGSGARLATTFPDVEVIVLPDNAGPGAAIAAAFAAVETEPTWFWLVEDDSEPAPDCLDRALRAAAACGEGVGIVGPVGCEIRWGQWYATPPLPPDDVREVDFVVLDGALVSGVAVREAGSPRRDYFIMMIDVEYPLRISRLGHRMIQAGLPYHPRRLGAAASDSGWRHYYQTRNHLRMAIDLRSPRLVAGFLIRSAKHVVSAGIGRDWSSIGLRLRGLSDAVRGRMGRTLEPPRSDATVSAVRR